MLDALARPAAAVDRRRSSRGSTCAAPGSRRCSRCSTSTARSGGCTGGWTATGEPWAYDAERYARVAADRGRRAAGDARLRRAPTGCRMEFLRRQLDDPEARGARAAAATAAPGAPLPTEVVDRRRSTRPAAALGRPGVEVEPRRMWPTGMSELGPRDQPVAPWKIAGLRHMPDRHFGNRGSAEVARI